MEGAKSRRGCGLRGGGGRGEKGASPRLVPPAWRGPLRLVGVPSGIAGGSGALGGVGLRGSMWSRGPGCGGVSLGGPVPGGA